MTRTTVLTFALVALLALAAPALAEPPANDTPGAAAEFRAITAENGTPDEREGIAELVEATPDGGVPSCLGPGSFARTVWFRVPAADKAREVRVEGSGRTTDVLDLAAFVQPASGANTGEPNACAGVGSGGADASEEPTAGVILRVPAGRSLLVQVGRRGAVGSAEDERAVLSLETRDLPDTPRPVGDEAGTETPTLAPGAATAVPLGGATTTEDEPGQPACPSLGGVWRRFVLAPGQGAVDVTATGLHAATLIVFSGERPTGEGAAGCTNRERSDGDLRLVTDVPPGQPVWVRVGTDRPPADASTTLTIVPTAATGRGPTGEQLVGPGAGCTPAGGFRAVAARAQGARVGLRFERRVPRPVTVDVFQQSIGRRVIGERLVARFDRRSSSFTWNGRANRSGRKVTDGYFVVRYRVDAPGGADIRRVPLRRVRGRFSVRPGYASVERCTLLRSAKLTRPVFGGRTNRELGVAFRVTRDANVSVEVLRGTKTVGRFPARLRRAGTLHRIRFASERRPRGDFRFRIVARSGAVTERLTLTARRL